MAKEEHQDGVRQWLRRLADEGQISLSALSQQLGKNRGYLENFIRKESPKALAYEDRLKLAKSTPIPARVLAVELHIRDLTERTVASPKQPDVGYGSGERTEPYKILTELVLVIGKVQAGAWAEAYQFPEGEWLEMRLPVDPRYAGIPRYGLVNEGLSMNRICRPGGLWIFVRLHDLTGIGAQAGNYVIVERVRSDGLVEATAKKLEVRAGKTWLCPDTDVPGFEPFPLDGGTDIEEVRVVGLVTDVVNRL